MPDRILSVRNAVELLGPLFAQSGGERLAAAHLDADGAVLKVVDHGGGGAAHVDLPVRAILFEALQLGAAAIVVAHNHPSGNAWPSRADCAATRLLAETARALEVELRDHLIFAGGDCRSFREMGLL